MDISIPKLTQYALQEGLELLGHTDMSPVSADQEYLRQWQDAGYAADLGYMKRDASLLASPERLFEGSGSIVCFAIRYSHFPPEDLHPGFGRIARYAVGRDYHRVLKKKLKRFVARVSEGEGVEINYRVFSDAVPLLERALARRSGLGFQGKNSMLIKPRLGSYFFLAELFWDLTIKGPGLPLVSEDCGSCQRCQEHCPTNAIVADHVIDAGRCISYLTIEKRGWLSYQERRYLGEWIFGCDLCQEICPFNHRAHREESPAAADEFSNRYAVPGQLELDWLLSIRSDDDFLRQFAGTPLMRAKRQGVLRNSAAVAQNTGAYELIPRLHQCVSDDSDQLIRLSAAGALLALYGQQGERSKVESIRNRICETEGDAGREVCKEWESQGAYTAVVE